MGCGSSRSAPPTQGGDGSVIIPIDGSTDSSVDGGPMGECEDPMGPMVAITSPAPVSDPNSPDVITSNLVTVACSGTETSDNIDENSVEIFVTDSAGVVGQGVVNDLGGGSFEASIDMTALTSGQATIECRMLDNAEEPLCNSNTVETLIDRGPVIEIQIPTEFPSAHSGSMTLEYTITGVEIVPGDSNAAVAMHDLVVAGKGADDGLVPICTTAGLVLTCTAEVDFTDMGVFPEPVEGERLLTITAVNGRGTETIAQRAFVRDSVGPMISILEPAQGQLVGGLYDVIAEVTDDSGVVDSVAFRISNIDGEIAMPSIGSKQYSGRDDASRFPDTTTEITINVTAVDLLGNEYTASRSVKLDTRSPLAELDPPNVRTSQEQQGILECSISFDPVGVDAPDDGEVLGTLPVFRVRTEDRSNTGVSANPSVITVSGVSSTGVQLFILDDVTKDLVVDTTGDGLCNDINPDVVQTPGGQGQAVVIDFAPISVGGDEFYPGAQDFTSANPDNAGAFDPLSGETAYETAGCVSGDDTDAPDPECDGTAMSFVIAAYQETGGEQPAIFAEWDMPGGFSGSRCHGDSFDPTQSIEFGWACAAVRTSDGLGNTNVSAPIRVCFEDPDTLVETPPGSGILIGANCDNFALGTKNPSPSQPCGMQACEPERFAPDPTHIDYPDGPNPSSNSSLQYLRP